MYNCSDSEKNMSACFDQNHAPGLTWVRLEFTEDFTVPDTNEAPDEKKGNL